MDAQKILEVIDRYDACLEPYGEGRQYPHDRHFRFDSKTALLHGRYMVGMVRMFLAEARLEKSFRWLGFIQCIFWVCGFYTLNQLKDHSRPKEAESFPLYSVEIPHKRLAEVIRALQLGCLMFKFDIRQHPTNEEDFALEIRDYGETMTQNPLRVAEKLGLKINKLEE